MKQIQLQGFFVARFCVETSFIKKADESNQLNGSLLEQRTQKNYSNMKNEQISLQ